MANLLDLQNLAASHELTPDKETYQLLEKAYREKQYKYKQTK